MDKIQELKNAEWIRNATEQLTPRRIGRWKDGQKCFVIDTPTDCLHCKMRACLHIGDKHYQLCGLQISHYGWGTEAFFSRIKI